jgi:hypothetical protein
MEVKMYHLTSKISPITRPLQRRLHLKLKRININTLGLSYSLISLLILLCIPWVSEAKKETHSQNLPRLAVLDFRDEAQLPTFERAALADSVRGAALNAPFMVMTKENMVALLPPGTDLESCIDDCEVEVGRTLGAHYIITGIVGRIDQRLQLLLRLYETQSGSLRGQSTITAKTVGEMQPKVRRRSLQMLIELSPSLKAGFTDQRTLLFVRVKPRKAKVKLDGFPIPMQSRRAVNDGFLVPIEPGKHKVQARARGYVTKSIRVSVREGEPVEADLRLHRKANNEDCHSSGCQSDVFVFTRPPGARIYLNGIDTGLTTQRSSMNPQLGSVALRVNAGKHWITAKKSPYDEAERLITVKSRDLYNGFREAPLVLSKAKGYLLVNSKPSGAMVRLNGQVVGKTPLKKRRLLARPYWVEVIAKGYQSREELVTVKRGRLKKVHWNLTSSTASLNLKVSYRGEKVKHASVWLDDLKIGETDDQGKLSLNRVMTGDHHLQVKHPLYIAGGEALTLRAGQTVHRHIKMRGAFGYLTIDTSELRNDLTQWTHRSSQQKEQKETEDTERLVTLWGGVSIGAAPYQKIKVSAGKRWLQVRPPLAAESVYGPSSQKINIKAGEVVKIKPSWKRHRARLDIRTSGVKSKVLLDGIKIGTTPYRGYAETGAHTLELVATNFSSYRKLIWLTKEGYQSDIDFKKRTTLTISCAPFKGHIEVDGMSVGPSPQIIDIIPGQHLISCLARGAEASQRIDIVQGQQISKQLTISAALLGEAYQSRLWWRQSSKVGVGIASATLIGGATVILALLPKTLDDRSQTENQWLVELNPTKRYEYQANWSSEDAKARNQHQLGWSLVSMGLGLGVSSAVTWWLNQE